MLIAQRFLDELKAGRVDLAFRRWPRARVTAGTHLRTAIGVVEVVSVDVVPMTGISEREAHRAGFESASELRCELRARKGRVHRIPAPASTVAIAHAGRVHPQLVALVGVVRDVEIGVAVHALETLVHLLLDGIDDAVVHQIGRIRHGGLRGRRPRVGLVLVEGGLAVEVHVRRHAGARHRPQDQTQHY